MNKSNGFAVFFFHFNALYQNIKKLKSIERKKVQETIKVSVLPVFRLLLTCKHADNKSVGREKSGAGISVNNVVVG